MTGSSTFIWGLFYFRFVWVMAFTLLTLKSVAKFPFTSAACPKSICNKSKTDNTYWLVAPWNVVRGGWISWALHWQVDRWEHGQVHRWEHGVTWQVHSTAGDKGLNFCKLCPGRDTLQHQASVTDVLGSMTVWHYVSQFPSL